MFNLRVLLVGVLIFIYGCRGFIERPANRFTEYYTTWKFYLQPFEGLHIYLDRQPIQWRVLSHDKTMGLLEIKVPVYKDQLGFFWEVKKKEFQTLRKDVFLQGEHRDWLESKPTFILDQIKSQHKFHSYHRVGEQPKSITFLDDERVAVPLLDGSGIDIVYIQTGKKKRIAPPAKYARHGGFVESLVLKDQNELWVSQMSKNALHIFDLDDLKYKQSVKLSGSWVKTMYYQSEKKLLYASNWSSKNISVVDPIRYQEIKKLDAAGIPRGLWVHPETGKIFIAQFGKANYTDKKGKVVQIDLESGMIVSKMGEYGSKRHLVYSHSTRKLYVSDMKRNRIEQYDTTTGENIKSIIVASKPNTIVLEPSQKYLYVSCRGQNSPRGYLYKGNVFGQIDVIDLENNRIVESIQGGNQPTGLDISPNGRYVVFSDFLDDAVRVYERLKN